MAAYVDHARAIAEDLRSLDGVELVPDPPFTNMMHIYLQASAEGLTDAMLSMIRRELSASAITKAGAMLARPAFRNIKRRLDYTEYGGAPLLGVRQIVVIGHGSSNARAIRSAIRSVKEFSEHRAGERIENGIAETNAREFAIAGNSK